MENSYAVNTPTHVPRSSYSTSIYPGRVIAIAVGIILLAGAAIAAWQLHTQWGYKSLLLLIVLPLAVPLIVVDTKSLFRFLNPTCLSSRPFGFADPDKIVVIGSFNHKLPEEEIQRELAPYPERTEVDAVIIYGNRVAFNRDPGFIKLNPRKVILVGSWIIHAPADYPRLDDLLHPSKGWNARTIRSVSGETFIKQLQMPSVKAALDHWPSRSSLFNTKRQVYVVSNQ